MSRIQQLYNDGFKYLLEEKFEEALDVFDQCLKTDPNFSQAHGAKGLALMRRADRDWHAALACLDKALSLNPADAAMWDTKGHILGQVGAYTEALYCLERSISLTEPLKDRENDSRAIYMTALIDESWIFTDGFLEFDKAIECCKKVLKLDPDHQDAKRNMGVARDRKQHGQALAVTGTKNCPYCKAIMYYWARYCPMCGRTLHLP